MYFMIQVVSVMTAVMTDMGFVMSVIIRIMWLMIRMVWLMKKLMSGPIPTITELNRGAKNPTLVPG